MTLQEKDLKYIWHPCSQMKDYEKLPPIIIDHAIDYVRGGAIF